MSHPWTPETEDEKKVFDRECQLEKVTRWHKYIGKNSRAQELFTEANDLWKKISKESRINAL